MYSIGELSRRTGVKVPTIRYYEQIGLLPEAERSSGNQRLYSRKAMERLAFIRHARDLRMLQRGLGYAQLSTNAIYADAVGEEEQHSAAQILGYPPRVRC